MSPVNLTLPPGLAQSDASSNGGVAATISAEIVSGFRAWPIWMIMGWDDVRQRYRRSILGPFWITLSMGIFILLLGVIFSRLFHVRVAVYMPYLTAGYIMWGFLSSSTVESCIVFHESSRIIKQIKLPYSIYVLRAVWRNFIVYLHTIVIYIPVAIVFKVEPTLMTLYLLPGLLLVLVNQIWVAVVLGLLSTRYRDVHPIVVTIVQVTMFATPVMWIPSSLGNLSFIAQINPIYHLIEITRAPLLGEAPELQSWLVAIVMAIVGSVAATALLVRTSRRIVYWL